MFNACFFFFFFFKGGTSRAEEDNSNNNMEIESNLEGDLEENSYKSFHNFGCLKQYFYVMV